jgi:hypothetical protein
MHAASGTLLAATINSAAASISQTCRSCVYTQFRCWFSSCFFLLLLQELQVQAGNANSGTAVVQKCPVNFLLESSNKGFEGAHVFTGKDGGRYLIGLCEGERSSS